MLVALYLWTAIGISTFDADFLRRRWFWFPVLTALWWLLANLGDLYDTSVTSKRFAVTRQVGIVGLSLLVVYLISYFFLPRDFLPRLFFLFFIGLTFALVLLWRWVFPRRRSWDAGSTGNAPSYRPQRKLC